MRESDVLRQVLDYLAVEHKFAIRLNTGNFYDHGRAFRSHNLGVGTADILVVPPDACWVEVKSPAGRQSSAQMLFEQWVTSLGHRYVLARSIDDLKGIGL